MEQSDNKKSETITFLGVRMSEEDFPVLYKWAKSNPATLEEQLKSIAEKWHEGDIISAAQALESDSKY